MTRSQWVRFAYKSVTDWRESLRLAVAVCRGTYYALFFRVFRRDVIIALPFLAFESVSITGPGHVRIGPYCSVLASAFDGLSIVTLSDAAVVEVGARCSLGGLVVRCRRLVRLGDDVMTASSLVQDSLVLSDEGEAAESVDGGPGQVAIGQNAWLGMQTCVAGRASVGDGAVLSWGTVCLQGAVPALTLTSGNPSGRAVPVEKLRDLLRVKLGMR
jgi:carbonic anhydrase/acetyltransferase-like protein (isoleucine patch superfamily)